MNKLVFKTIGEWEIFTHVHKSMDNDMPKEILDGPKSYPALLVYDIVVANVESGFGVRGYLIYQSDFK